MKELKFIDFNEFKKKWKKNVEEQAKKKNIKMNAEFWILNVQNFLEFFFLEHLHLSIDDCIEFGYTKELEAAGNKINSKDLSTSLIYCSANEIFNLSDSLKSDAYNYALNLYKRNSQETKKVIAEVVAKYENEYDKYEQSIINNIDDYILVARMKHIRKVFEFREADYKAIKQHLITEFDTSLVFDFEDLYNTYAIAYHTQKAKETL